MAGKLDPRLTSGRAWLHLYFSSHILLHIIRASQSYHLVFRGDDHYIYPMTRQHSMLHPWSSYLTERGDCPHHAHFVREFLPSSTRFSKSNRHPASNGLVTSQIFLSCSHLHFPLTCANLTLGHVLHDLSLLKSKLPRSPRTRDG
jgi:hypothetical protein